MFSLNNNSYNLTIPYLPKFINLLYSSYLLSYISSCLLSKNGLTPLTFYGDFMLLLLPYSSDTLIIFEDILLL